jgi:hypothetical protein
LTRDHLQHLGDVLAGLVQGAVAGREENTDLPKHLGATGGRRSQPAGHAGLSGTGDLRNFPMQANGAEMMRLAACFATERGVEVCAPVHDAFLICSPLDRLDEDVAKMRAAMAEASRIVLGGFELSTDASITRWPERYMDPRGAVMWRRVMALLATRDQARRTA